MDNYQATIDRCSVVKRILPHVQTDDIPSGSRCWGLAAKEFELVTMGYACSSCLACWEPLILDQCPMCGEIRDTGRQVVQRPDWEEHEAYRQHELANPTRTVVPTMDKMVDEISAEALEGHIPGKKRNL